MIDLKELERKLDEALEMETEESLTKWLNEKRAKRANKFAANLGEGELEVIKETYLVISNNAENTVNVTFVGYDEMSEDSNYSKAA